MPSPPNFPHYTIDTNSSHYTSATTRVGAISAHSWGRPRFHQPAAIYDPASGLDSHAPFRHQDYVSTDYIFLPSSHSFTGPAQQPSPSTTQYTSPMSRQPSWAYLNYTQWHPANPPVDPFASASAPSIAHKIWLLECKHCLTFLTNRGMKAVLLLRPHVPLYSTDALPVNCSAYSARLPSTGSPRRQPTEQQPRTCECLTQALCCHGCGTAVGYMIVVPCARCISSSSAMNRVTNGHRFVFHSSELIASERHYTPGEPGILPAYTEPSSSSSRISWSPRSFLPTPDLANIQPSLTTSPSLTSSYSTMPILPPESPCPVPSPVLADPQKPNPQQLRAGDVLYWHHLTQSGEIPGATDDPRSRGVSPTFYDRAFIMPNQAQENEHHDEKHDNEADTDETVHVAR